jgi:hypothetical protein
VGLFTKKVYFNRPDNLEHLRQRILAKMEQISPDIIERNVQGDSSFTTRAKTHTSNRFKILKKFRNDCVML